MRSGFATKSCEVVTSSKDGRSFPPPFFLSLGGCALGTIVIDCGGCTSMGEKIRNRLHPCQYCAGFVNIARDSSLPLTSHIHVCVSHSLFLSLSLSHLSALSVVPLSISFSLCFSVSVSVSVCVSLSLLSVYLSVPLSLCLSVCLSVYVSVCLCLCVCVSMCLSVCVSVCLCFGVFVCRCVGVSVSVCPCVCVSVCLCVCASVRLSLSCPPFLSLPSLSLADTLSCLLFVCWCWSKSCGLQVGGTAKRCCCVSDGPRGRYKDSDSGRDRDRDRGGGVKTGLQQESSIDVEK